MDDELKAAAERLILGQYRVTVRSLTGADDAAQMAFDRYHVARAYLADLDAKRRQVEDAIILNPEQFSELIREAEQRGREEEREACARIASIAGWKNAQLPDSNVCVSCGEQTSTAIVMAIRARRIPAVE